MLISGSYHFCCTNNYLFCNDRLIARGSEARILKDALDASGMRWHHVDRKVKLEGQRIRLYEEELTSDKRRESFQDFRWDMPAQSRYDRPRDEELRGEYE